MLSMALMVGVGSATSPQSPRASVCPIICSLLQPVICSSLSVAPRRRLADWPPVGKTTHLSVNLLRPSNAFGGTPKAAGEEVRTNYWLPALRVARAPQSYCMVTVKEFLLNREPREIHETSGFFASFEYFAVHSVFQIGTNLEGTCLARSSFRFAVVKRGSAAPIWPGGRISANSAAFGRGRRKRPTFMILIIKDMQMGAWKFLSDARHKARREPRL